MKNKYLKALKVFYQYIYDYRLLYIFVLFITILASILENFGYTLIIPIVEVVLNNSDSRYTFLLKYFPSGLDKTEILSFFIILFSTLIFIKSLLNVAKSYFQNFITFEIRNNLRNKLYRKYLEKNYSNISKLKNGEIYHNIITEPNKISNSIFQSILFFTGIINTIIIYVILLSVSYKITLVMTFFVLLIASFILIFSHKKIRKYSKKIIKLNQDLSSNTSESISAIKQIKVFGIEKLRFNIFKKLSKEDSVLFIKSRVLRALARPILETVIILFFSSIFIFSLKMNYFELNEIIPILALFVFISPKLISSFTMLINNRMSIENAIPSFKLINRVLNDKDDDNKFMKNLKFKKLESNIEFNNLSFSYDSDKYVFKKLNLCFEKNKMTALKGKSGIGKSTIVDILCRFYNPTSGTIFINNNDYMDYDLKSWRNSIGYVSQDVFLFNETVLFNITLGNEYSEEKLNKVLELSHCLEFVEELKNGINTIVGERGINLSGGQKQRIAIARVLIRDPEIFIFDEATSALDNKSENYIKNSIEEIAKIKTVVVIAHRLSTIEKADKVYDLGNIIKGAKNE